jgi:hypothetical protein
MYKTVGTPVIVFGSETWALTEMGMGRLGTWERKLFKRYMNWCKSKEQVE